MHGFEVFTGTVKRSANVMPPSLLAIALKSPIGDTIGLISGPATQFSLPENDGRLLERWFTCVRLLAP